MDGMQADLMTTNPPENSERGFEEDLSELESIVDTLEKGDLTLEQSLAAFERGVKLTRTCQKALDEAEQRVRILTEKSADAELDPFERND
jgi:exodeoxyribonuclease VII small subunit